MILATFTNAAVFHQHIATSTHHPVPKPVPYDSELPPITCSNQQLIQQSQYEALKAVNKQLIELYWQIGERIVERQQAEGWGKSVVEQLAKDLQQAFPGTEVFQCKPVADAQFPTLPTRENTVPLVREIAWSHNLIIMEKCKKDEEREFYLKMTRKFGWTKNVLSLQIANHSFEKYLLNQTNFEQTLPEKYRQQANLAVKDEYTFGFLELANEHAEHELEESLGEKHPQFPA